jgi:predicted glycosyltransferase
VGGRLLASALDASGRLAPDLPHRLLIFTGPYLDDDEYRGLETTARSMGWVCMSRFTDDFSSYLSAADLSVSMAGYNTTMNLLACGAYGLVLPFAQNHEQRLRAERLEKRGALKVLDEADLAPDALAGHMRRTLQRRGPPRHGVDLNGAENSARRLEALHSAACEGKGHG